MQKSDKPTIENRDLALQSLQEGTPNTSNQIITSILPTLSHKLEVSSQLDSSTPTRIIKELWNQNENRLNVEFWLQNFIKNPYGNYSIDNPLIKKSHSKALSLYLKKQGSFLNPQCNKIPKQCKNKYTTIKRKIYRQRQKRSVQYDFIDYIIQEAENYKELNSDIEVKLSKVKQLKQNTGSFIQITFEQNEFIQRQSFKQTLDCFAEYRKSFEIKQYTK